MSEAISFKLFRFEHMWLTESGCGDIIREAWLTQMPHSSYQLVMEKIKLCEEKLVEWSKRSFGSVKKQIEEKSKLLERAEHAAARSEELV